MLVGTPEEARLKRKLLEFLVRNISEKPVSNETWAKGLDLLAEYLKVLVFPGITLKPMNSYEWFARMGLRFEGPLKERQGYYQIIGGYREYIIWGLTRDGYWVVDHPVSERGLGGGNSVQAKICSSGELLEGLGIFSTLKHEPVSARVYMIADTLDSFVSSQLEEKRKRLGDLERVYRSANMLTELLKARG